MLLPIKWMKDYVTLNEPAGVLADRLSATGTHVEERINPGKNLDNFVSCRILEINKHPQAEKLNLVTIDYGERKVIVTGAKNIKVGDITCFAQVGAVLPSGQKIEPKTFKGIESEGMLCSYQELGYDLSVVPKNSRDGLMILAEDVIPGTPIKQVLDLDDEVLDVEITPNRPDCLSITGLAREAAASFGCRAYMPDVLEMNWENTDIFNGVEIESAGALRYTARFATDIVVKDSPQWLQNRLMLAGMRPINNIVDITNYVMLELGQPLHAFDVATLTGKKIVVRDAQVDEKIITLDGEQRDLTQEDVLITDGTRPLALAGIMGGLDSEITEKTETILIESAAFDSSRVRKTSKRLGLRTESSTRFEKGLSPVWTSLAADRVLYLIEKIGCGKAVHGGYDVYPNPVLPASIMIEKSFSEEKLGVKIDLACQKKILEDLDFEVQEAEEYWSVGVPYFRDDCRIKEDIVEEIGRIYGYEKIAPMPVVGTLMRGTKSPLRRFMDALKDQLFGLGFSEIATYSFISAKDYHRTGYPLSEDAIELINPLGEDFSVMRTGLLPNMIKTLDKNAVNGYDHLTLYEMGTVFRKRTDYEESMHLVLGTMGRDFYDMKERISLLLDAFGIKGGELLRLVDHPTFHPGRSAKWSLDGEELVIFGELHPSVAQNFHFKNRVYLAEFNLAVLLPKVSYIKTKKEIIKYPSIKRDVALLVSSEIESAAIVRLIHEQSPLIRNVRLFDIYEGDKIPQGKKSMAYEITYQAEDRTLVDDIVEDIQVKILQKLKDDFGISLRS